MYWEFTPIAQDYFCKEVNKWGSVLIEEKGTVLNPLIHFNTHNFDSSWIFFFCRSRKNLNILEIWCKCQRFSITVLRPIRQKLPQILAICRNYMYHTGWIQMTTVPFLFIAHHVIFMNNLKPILSWQNFFEFLKNHLFLMSVKERGSKTEFVLTLLFLACSFFYVIFANAFWA